MGQNKLSELPWLQAKEQGTGVSLNLGLSPWDEGHYTHSLSFDGTWRKLKGLPGEPISMAIRKCFGDSQKSSVSYNSCQSNLDFSDGNSIPVDGWRLGTSTEFAGLSGTSQFLKFMGNFQNYSSFGKLTSCLTCRAGFIYGSPDIQDKLYLGGPLDIRGYKFNEASPKTGGSKLFALGTHMYYPLSKQGINLHAFANAGATVDNLSDVQKSVKHSYGLGIAMGLGQAMGGARLEANYVIHPQPKVELGVGFSTL